MKKVKIGNPQFPNTHIEKEYLDNQDSKVILADLTGEMIKKLNLGKGEVISNKKIKDIGKMLDGILKEINSLDPKLGSEIRNLIRKK